MPTSSILTQPGVISAAAVVVVPGVGGGLGTRDGSEIGPTQPLRSIV